MFRVFFSVAAAVAIIFAGIFLVGVGGFIIFIFKRRLRRCDAFTTLLLFD
jgi:preprotein translocase subunit Sss1